MQTFFQSKGNSYTLRFGAALFVLLAAQAHASDLTGLGAASGYNAFIFSNFTESGTDSEGRIAVGGNFAPANGGFTVASHYGSDQAGTFDLVVGGNYTNQYNTVAGGDIFVGGNMNWTDPTLSHNAYVDGNVTNSSYGSVGGKIYYGGNYSSVGTLNNQKMATPMASPLDFLSIQTSIDALSANLAQQASNTTIQVAYNTYTMTGASPALNVFNLTDSNFNGSTINLSAPAGSTVIVNVAGQSASFNGGSINFSGVSASNVIFNFATAKSVNMASFGFNGTLLAPLATFNGTYGQINGELIANNANGTTELHDVAFTGNLTQFATGSTLQTSNSQIAATPEPSTWMLALSAGLALTASARRRRSQPNC